MITRRAERLLPYKAEDLFDLVADVERYPDFLPWWLKAHVKNRKGEIYYTDQELALGPIRIGFGSKTLLHRPKRIDVVSHDQPFRYFKLSWTFDSLPGARCRVRLITEFEFRSQLLKKIVERFVPDITPDIITAFEARAAWMHQETNAVH